VASVRWAEPARDDLAEIHDFIARDSPGAALALVERILRATEQLASFPESGRRVPEFPERTYRELIVGTYRVQYRVDGDSVAILTVVHGRRLLVDAP
jgi:plasmid stabilization system protein ParE